MKARLVKKLVHTPIDRLAPYWIGDEVGGACDFEETDVLNPEDMVRIIENNMSYDEYAEWREANLDDGRYINLRSWLMGARHDMLKEEKK